MRLILAVCTGNICRSPVAEGLIRDGLQRNFLRDWKVESRGVSALEGHRATEPARVVAGEVGVDIGAHRGRLLTSSDIRDAELIVTMERWQRDEVREELPPEFREKVQLLNHFHPDVAEKEIADPYGRSLKFYRNCRDEIARGVEALLRHLADS